MSQVTPEQLQLALLKAFTDKHDAEAKVAEANLQITAIRNLLTGHQMAQQAAAMAAAAAAAQVPAPPAP